MKDLSARRNLFLTIDHLASGSINDFFKGLLHVAHHGEVFLAPLPVEAKDGNAVSISRLGIDFNPGLTIGNHFATARKTECVAEDFAPVPLEFGSVSIVNSCGNAAIVFNPSHLGPTEQFNVIAASKISSFHALEPPGNNQVSRIDTVFIFDL